MKRVYTSADPLIVGHLEAVLSERGIVCMVRNRFLSGGAGELPPTDLWPELCVGEEDADLAKKLIGEILGVGVAPGPDWQCPDCGETIEGQFAACWNCGRSGPV